MRHLSRFVLIALLLAAVTAPAFGQSRYIGQITLFPYDFAPVGWAFCEGQLVPISQNETLFNLIGTTYGGDGQNTFALPDLRGRVAIHMGSGFTIGQSAGEETVTLTVNQIPSHTHSASGSASLSNTASPTAAYWAPRSRTLLFSTASSLVQMNAGALANTGGGQPHDNMKPFLALHYAISLFGVFPSQN